MQINVSVDLDSIWDDCGASYSEVVKEELQHEFKLAVRRAMKADKDFEKEVKAMVKRMREAMWKEQAALLARLGEDDE